MIQFITHSVASLNAPSNVSNVLLMSGGVESSLEAMVYPVSMLDATMLMTDVNVSYPKS